MLKILFGALATLIIFFGVNFDNPAQARVKKPVETVKENILPVHKHSAACEETDAEPVQIICILDRSGSMSNLAEDTIGGYNSFLEKQKQTPGKVEVTTVLFDNQYEKIADRVDLSEIEKLTSEKYYARGTTALLDAIGMTLTNVAGKMEKENICPAKRRVLVLIMTDGLENASVEYNKATVKAMIEQTTENYKWNYIFMGANIDSVSEAQSLGIAGRNAMNFSSSSAGVRKTFEKMDDAASAVRESGAVDENWKDEN